GCGGAARRRTPFSTRALLAALLVDGFLQLLAGLETHALAGLDRDGIARRWVAALARCALREGEAAETRHLRRLPGLDRLRDGCEHRFEGLRGLPPRQPLHGVHNAINQVSFTSHLSSSLDSFSWRR